MSSYYSSSFDGSYVGGSEKNRFNLCQSGHFRYYGHSNVSVDVGSSGYGHNTQNDRGDLVCSKPKMVKSNLIYNIQMVKQHHTSYHKMMDEHIWMIHVIIEPVYTMMIPIKRFGQLFVLCSGLIHVRRTFMSLRF